MVTVSLAYFGKQGKHTSVDILYFVKKQNGVKIFKVRDTCIKKKPKRF